MTELGIKRAAELLAALLCRESPNVQCARRSVVWKDNDGKAYIVRLEFERDETLD